MKEHTVKLSGHAKDRFLERFFAEEEGLDADTRKRLVSRSKGSMTSLRVRKAVVAGQRRIAPRFSPLQPDRGDTAGSPVEEQDIPGEPEVQPAPVPVEPQPVAAMQPSLAQVATAEPVVAPKPADPYAVKLVPVFQREGRDGLLAKLADVGNVEHLRQIAKAQQIILPQPLRSGEADAETVRVAIADAVAKRVADRRAAAG